MPTVNLSHIVSFSSEDIGNKARNLISGKGGWKCEKEGESSASCIIQLDKCHQISNIDIGNDGSAFVSVHVGRSASNDDSYQVLLNSHSFMSSNESRVSTSCTRVKMFDTSKFAPNVSAQMWDRIKVVCTQPFNKRVKYGIAFITLRSVEEKVNNKHVTPDSVIVEEPKVKQFGAFKLLPQKKPDKLPDASSIRTYLVDEAVKHGFIISIVEKMSVKTKKQADELIAEKIKNKKENKEKIKRKLSDTTSSLTPQSKIPRKKEATPKQPQKTSVSKVKTPLPSNTTPVPSSRVDQPSTSRAKSPPNITKPPAAVQHSYDYGDDDNQPSDYDVILKGVVFVLSGYQNPERNDIRQLACDMGAKYCRDWIPSSCTHLICAFKNTPKFQQVLQQSPDATVVNKRWILACDRKMKKVDTAKYDMKGPSTSKAPTTTNNNTSSSNNDVTTSNSNDVTFGDEDDDNTIAHVFRGGIVKTSIAPTKTSEDATKSSNNGNDVTVIDDDDAIYDAETDTECDVILDLEKFDVKKPKTDENPVIDLEEFLANKSNAAESEVIYVDNYELEFPKLPQFFRKHKFFIFNKDMDDETEKLLYRIIICCHGRISEYMNDKVSHVVTSSQSWNEDFNEHEKVKFVHCDWLLECGKLEKLIDIEKYLISKN